jgi:hypothetical protein
MSGEQPIQQRQHPSDDEHDRNGSEKPPVVHLCAGSEGYGRGVGIFGFGLNFRLRYSGSVDADTASNNLFAAPIGRVKVSTKSSPAPISMLRCVRNGEERKEGYVK